MVGTVVGNNIGELPPSLSRLKKLKVLLVDDNKVAEVRAQLAINKKCNHDIMFDYPMRHNIRHNEMSKCTSLVCRGNIHS